MNGNKDSRDKEKKMPKSKTKIQWQGQIKEDSIADSQKILIKDSKVAPKQNKNPIHEKSDFKIVLQNYSIAKSKRRGHQICIISNFVLSSNDDLKNLSAVLKSKLACGGSVEDDTLILQSVDIDKINAVLEKLKT
jgi:translation initiation factor 1 (eIF-1/SUI1)